MRSSSNLSVHPFAAYVSTLVLAAMCWLDATAAFAGNTPIAGQTPPLPTIAPQAQSVHQTPNVNRIKTNRPNRLLGFADEVATLHAIHTALNSVGDGGAFVWQRGNGRLDGLIRPTASFKSSSGQICRHVIIRLTSGYYSREVEGIACQDGSGTWSLT